MSTQPTQLLTAACTACTTTMTHNAIIIIRSQLDHVCRRLMWILPSEWLRVDSTSQHHTCTPQLWRPWTSNLERGATFRLDFLGCMFRSCLDEISCSDELQDMASSGSTAVVHGASAGAQHSHCIVLSVGPHCRVGIEACLLPFAPYIIFPIIFLIPDDFPLPTVCWMWVLAVGWWQLQRRSSPVCMARLHVS